MPLLASEVNLPCCTTCHGCCGGGTHQASKSGKQEGTCTWAPTAVAQAKLPQLWWQDSACPVRKPMEVPPAAAWVKSPWLGQQDSLGTQGPPAIAWVKSPWLQWQDPRTPPFTRCHDVTWHAWGMKKLWYTSVLLSSRNTILLQPSNKYTVVSLRHPCAFPMKGVYHGSSCSSRLESSHCI